MGTAHRMKIMIFAAGLGTRLKPMTDTLPKALVPVGGKPLLEHILEKAEAASDPVTGSPLFDGAVVNVHHFADMIVTWLSERDGSLPVAVSDERDMLLETGGGILHARKHLEGCGSFLVHNVDIISDLDLSRFIYDVRPDALATLLVSDRKTTRYLLFNPRDMRLAGWTNVSTGEVRSPYLGAADVPDELAGADGTFDPGRCVRMAFSGIHILSDRVFDVMEEYAGGDERFPIMDFYLSVCAVHNIYGVIAEGLRMIDVGKPDTLEQAEKIFTKPLYI